jgi:cellulose synthase/poly-beta-1,6-N-acetylglucosamine synthase-like glycosyltransferase
LTRDCTQNQSAFFAAPVTAVIPAHNEQESIAAALRGLKNQTVPPIRILVIADNCTDDTAEIAIREGVEIFATQGNTAKKAGALNQAMSELLPALSGDEAILVTDADCVLDPGFIENALPYLCVGYGGVGGTFRGQAGSGLVGHLQRNEYARYARDVRRLNGKCLVLTGTATLFSARVLTEVSRARLAGRLPTGDGNGGIYDTTVLTEDNELSFALLHLEYRIIAPAGCTLTTEVMPTWTALWKQRLRWKRGAVENCVQYGITRFTAKYWGRQIVTMIGCIVSGAYLLTVAIAAAEGNVHLQPLWIAVSLVFILERIVTVRDKGWRQMILSATAYEIPYEYYLQFCNAKAYLESALRRDRNW